MAIEVKIGAYQAYAIAKERGFEGTEEEWLDSLRGSGIQSVRVSADGDLIFTIKDSKTGEERELDPVAIENLEVINQIIQVKDSALSEMLSTQNGSIFNINVAKTEAVDEVNSALIEAQQQIKQSEADTILVVEQTGKTIENEMKEEIQTFVSQLNDETIEAINTVKDSSLGEIEQAKTGAIQSINDFKSEAVRQASEEINTIAQTTVVESKDEILDITSQFTAEANKEISLSKENSILEINNVTEQKLEKVTSDIEDEKVLAINKLTEKQEEVISSIDESLINAKQEINTAIDKAIEFASDSIDEFKASAASDIDTAKTDAIGAVNTAGDQAASDALSDIDTAKTDAVDAVNAAGAQAASDAQTAITAAKNQAVSDVQNAGQTAVEAVEEAQTASVQAVEGAQTNAVQAVQDAGGAEAERLSDIVPLVTEADNGKILTVLDGKWTAVNPAITNWEKVQLLVRAGLAPQYFPAGYEFITHDSMEDTDIVWRVVGHDTIKAADETLTHTMILETKYVYSKSPGSYISLQFDAQEALYYAKEELLAGTYNFTLLENYDTTYGGGKTYSFILTKPVPAGGVIMFPWGYNQQASEVKISTYATQADTTAIETVPVTEGSEGTSLGTADGKTENMNHNHRIRYGSNNYAQSAIEQWLNSKEAAGNVWRPQTKFDRSPSWASSQAGFMARLPEDFIAVIQPAIVPCRTNSVYEVNSLDGTEFVTNQTYSLKRKFFLLSRPEISGTWDNSELKDGEQLEYYKGLMEAERIKYEPSGLARYCWVRTPTINTAGTARVVNLYGSLTSVNTSDAVAIAPACIIA